ncbi:hypothetical protein NMY22_g4478 [Coprinellus aureogranulatus]|nr:hypothetical protein NMY22_g4478 [Coprinellus aureogranulatus]
MSTISLDLICDQVRGQLCWEPTGGRIVLTERWTGTDDARSFSTALAIDGTIPAASSSSLTKLQIPGRACTFPNTFSLKLSRATLTNGGFNNLWCYEVCPLSWNTQAPFVLGTPRSVKTVMRHWTRDYALYESSLCKLGTFYCAEGGGCSLTRCSPSKNVLWTDDGFSSCVPALLRLFWALSDLRISSMGAVPHWHPLVPSSRSLPSSPNAIGQTQSGSGLSSLDRKLVPIRRMTGGDLDGSQALLLYRVDTFFDS